MRQTLIMGLPLLLLARPSAVDAAEGDMPSGSATGEVP